jgi:hypothetical protein
MPSWWNSPEVLSQVTTWLRVAIVVFGVLTALSTGVTIVTGNRIDRLRGREREELAKELKETGKRLEEADHRVQDAQRRLGDAEKKAAPRGLSREQTEALASSLRPLRGKQLAVVTSTSDGEAYRFGNEVVSALRSAGIEVLLSQRPHIGGSARRGYDPSGRSWGKCGG